MQCGLETECRLSPAQINEEASTSALDQHTAQQRAAQHDGQGPGRGSGNDMLVTPSRLSRASSAMCEESSQPAPPTPMSTAAECSSPPSMAAVYHVPEDGRPAGT